jgi:DNA-binding NarL/FixJ family response regulator
MMFHQARSSQPLLMAGKSNNRKPAGSAISERRVESSLNCRVLIVEDEALVALNIEGALTEAGFDVVGTFDTEHEAVNAAQQLRPDLVILDITLSEGDGISAAKKIQQSTSSKIIFVSGNSDPRTLSAAYGVQPAGFIRKPFVTESFAKFVIDALALKN